MRISRLGGGPVAVTLLSLLLLLLPAAARAQGDSSSSALAALAALPDCATGCLLSALANSTCEPTDLQCLCTNPAFNEASTKCVMAQCTVKETLFTKNTTETNCHAPRRDKSGSLSGVCIALGVLSACFVVARLVFKGFLTQSEVTADDWMILVALLAGIPNTVLIARGDIDSGLGKDVWTLPFGHITRFLQYFYVTEIIYFLEVTLLKASILLFYLRIFPARHTRRLLWATLVFNGLFGLAFVVGAVFQCRPIRYYWLQWDGEHRGTCLNVNALGWANAAISIAVDLWMLGIPLFELRHLNLHWKKKVGVALMFVIGTFVTVVSILRLRSLVTFANSSNPTWDNYDVVLWSTVELNVGYICACMPTTRLMLVRLFPILGGSTRRDYYYGYNHNNRNHHNGPNSRGATAGSRGVVSSSRGGVSHSRSVAETTVAGPGTSTPPEGQITYQKGFTVQYSDHDEASLVHMRDLDLNGRQWERSSQGSI
ncbi:hypothetical protein VTK73DRAFT_8740 [Phialemonium thermophilum]|uniref:CFEM domain-containing protein n=1 Tax=Phialemonium thermophilum TaxID=223376 RepID=A0ABR3W6N0_9PEZI